MTTNIRQLHGNIDMTKHTTTDTQLQTNNYKDKTTNIGQALCNIDMITNKQL
jgi:hypothetical protein